MNPPDEPLPSQVIDRLKRIEGQARGVQRMVEQGRDCEDIMHQIAAMRAASRALSIELLEQFAIHCLRHTDDAPSMEKAVAQMVSAIEQLTR